MSGVAKVTAAYVHTDEVPDNFNTSYKGLILWDLTRSGHLAHPAGEIRVRGVAYDLVTARNMIAKEFLESDSEWLLSIDSDMGFKPNSLDTLLAAADAKERPIMGGLCFASRETGQDGLGGYRTVARPTILRWVDHEGVKAFRGVAYYPINRVMRCDATGMAFILIHRSVFQKIKDEYGECWYTRTTGTDGSLLGEDISFCLRAGSLGLPVHVHTGVRTNHHKPRWVGETDFWQSYLAPPASEPTAVVVPVRGRPAHAEPFMASLRASTGLATAYAVAHREDTESIEAWKQQGANVLLCEGHTFMEKANLAYRGTSEPWIFLTGDDVRFHPAWLDHAQHVAAIERKGVIGTNDLANPRVLAGEHAVHWLFNRDYIREKGASWDGPGIICHEGYRYWYTDDEIVAAAKQRDEWAMAMASIVEHFHPAWGTAPDDDTYRLGRAHIEEDRKLFKKRLRRSLERETANAR